MKSKSNNEDLYRHLSSTRGITVREAAQIVNEVSAYFQESSNNYIRRRHQELQLAGISNAEIYQQILSELESRRFPATLTSERQIRRVIYG